MIEPGVRYLPMVPIPSQSVSLEAAVDLTKKSWPALSHHDTEEGDDGGSDSDTPLDMSVTATVPQHHLSPVFPGFQRPDRDISPARSDRSDFIMRLPGLYSPGSTHGNRERSTDRSDLDKGKDHQAQLGLTLTSDI